MRIKANLTVGRLVVFAFAAEVAAQSTTGSILGTVTDQSRAVMPGVSVTVKNTETGATRSLVTDEAGRYRALNLPPGRYEVTAELAGFLAAVLADLVVTIGKDLEVNIVLKVGEVSERVTVSAEVPEVERTSVAVGGLVSTKQISELPLNGRSFAQLATLQPGAATRITRTVTTSRQTQFGLKILF